VKITVEGPEGTKTFGPMSKTDADVLWKDFKLKYPNPQKKIT
jgi:hypothetical protein